MVAKLWKTAIKNNVNLNQQVRETIVQIIQPALAERMSKSYNF